MCGEHMHAPPVAGELSSQPGSAAALGLSFPSCEVGVAEAAPRAPAGPTVSEGLGQSRGGGSGWTLATARVQGQCGTPLLGREV